MINPRKTTKGELRCLWSTSLIFGGCYRLNVCVPSKFTLCILLIMEFCALIFIFKNAALKCYLSELLIVLGMTLNFAFWVALASP